MKHAKSKSIVGLKKNSYLKNTPYKLSNNNNLVKSESAHPTDNLHDLLDYKGTRKRGTAEKIGRFRKVEDMRAELPS